MSNLYGLIIVTQAYASHVRKYSYKAEFVNSNGDKLEICFCGPCYVCTDFNGEMITDKGVQLPFTLRDWTDFENYSDIDDDDIKADDEE